MKAGAAANPTALVIDDEPAIRKLLRQILEAEAFIVKEASTGQGGLTEAAYAKPDVVILDLGLPDTDGLETLKRLREWSSVPVLILSVRQDVDDKVEALDAGANDYLTKPFHAAELVARLRAIRRQASQVHEDPVYRCGALEVDFVARAIRVREGEIHLTATEYALLRILIRNRGKVVTHRQLLRDVWGPVAGERSQYLRVYVNRLRKKICPASEKHPSIQNEAGIGYRFLE
ncbi:MAG: response regulator [Candidatus Hydrogenedentota bacterium]